MSSALWVGAMFGLSAGFAPGPLLTLVITQTLRHNVKEGILTATAPVLTDVPIILISFLILNELSDFGVVLGLITAIGGGYVFYLSYETITTGPIKIEAPQIQPRSLRKGVLVNALNPHPYLFWATVGVPFILKVRGENPYAAWIFILSFFSLLIGAKMVVALIVGKFSSFLQGRLYRYAMKVLGVILAVFAAFLIKDALVHFGIIS